MTPIHKGDLIQWAPDAICAPDDPAKRATIGRVTHRLIQKKGRVSICIEWPDGRHLWTDENQLVHAPAGATFTLTAAAPAAVDDDTEAPDE